jgi:hypothetical protein
MEEMKMTQMMSFKDASFFFLPIARMIERETGKGVFSNFSFFIFVQRDHILEFKIALYFLPCFWLLPLFNEK